MESKNSSILKFLENDKFEEKIRELLFGSESIVYGKLKVPKVASKNTQYCR